MVLYRGVHPIIPSELLLHFLSLVERDAILL